MTGSIFIGVDIGSSATKALAVREDGRVLASIRRPHSISYPRPGWAEMDAERDWWGGMTEAVRQLLRAPDVHMNELAGIGVCGIGASLVPVGAAGQALRPGILYGIDSRASAEIRALNEQFGEERLFAQTGRRLSAQSVGPKIAWLRHAEPQVWRATARLLTPISFITRGLCGAEVIDLHSALTFDPLFDPSTGNWDAAMCDAVLGSGTLLPSIGRPGDRIGRVTADAATATGLPMGLPVACGTADVVAEALGAGVREVGDMLVMYGSTLFLLGRVASFKSQSTLWPSMFLSASEPTLLAGASNAGSLLAWFEREIAGSGGLEPLLAQAALLPPGADGLLCLPYFFGERAPIYDPDARGLFLGLTGRHTRAHLLRALMESIAFSFRHLLDTFFQAGHTPRRLFGSGGGVRSPLWPQLMTDISGIPQQINPAKEGAALGAALLGAHAGERLDASAGLPAGWGGDARQVMPDLANAAKYDALYALFLKAYSVNVDLMHKLADSAR